MSAVYIADSPPMMVWAYVFITSRQPKRLLPRVRSISGVVHADALFGSPDIIAIVAGDNIKVMDEVIDQIAELSDVVATDTKVARWLDGIGPPNPHTPAA
jgi:Lrp/AsnC ligand binding domain